MSVKEEAIEESVASEVKSEDPDSGDEIPDPNPNALVHEIRCGLLTGKLHMEKFTCPGIHKRCIEHEGKLISPRQFTIAAEKDKQKDWKGSIRLGRYNLRTLMELKTLDFYAHATNCSLKCQSRNYIKNRKSEAAETLSLMDSMLYLPDQPSSSVDFDSTDADSGEIPSTRRKGSSVLEDYVAQTVNSVNSASRIGNLCQEEMIKVDEIIASISCAPALPPSSVPPIVANPFSSPEQQRRRSPVHQKNTPNGQQQIVGNFSKPPLAAPEIGNDAALAIILQSLVEQQKSLTQNTQANFLNNFLFGNLANNNNNHGSTKISTTNSLQNGANDAVLLASLGAMDFGANHQLPTRPNAQIDGVLSEDGNINARNLKKVMETSPVLFWSRMRELGILEDLLSTLSTTVDQLKHIYLHGGTGTEEFAAQKLSSLANILDLGSIYGEKLNTRYVQTTLESNLLSRELQELTRKAEEQKRKLENAKRKSQVFDQIIKSNGESPDFKRIHLNI